MLKALTSTEALAECTIQAECTTCHHDGNYPPTLTKILLN